MAKSSAKTKAFPLRTPDARVSALGIARATARDIERGLYCPGERLREQELADRFQCSRAPVREALRLLESRGSVVIEPMKGARIAALHDVQFREVFFIRRALAGMMAQQAAIAPRSKNKSHLIILAREMPTRAKTAADGHAFAADVREIIQALIGAAQTPRTVQLVQSLTFGHEAFQDEIVDIKRNRGVQASQWEKIGEAVSSGDANAARAAMEAIFDNSRAYMESRADAGRARRACNAKVIAKSGD